MIFREDIVAALEKLGIPPEDFEGVLRSVIVERGRQVKQWGGVEHDDGHYTLDWISYLTEHLGRAQLAAECRRTTSGKGFNYRGQLVIVAALAFAALESCDRLLREKQRTKKGPEPCS